MISWSREWRGLGLSALFVLVLYGPAVTGQGFFFERDVWLYWLPHVEWAVRTMASGQWPQWNPLVAFGAPFMADPNFQFFYPPTAATWLLPPRVGYTVLVVGHSLFGALGAFILLRPRLRSTASALLGVMAFVGAGPLVSSANLWHHFCSAMYMPWVLDAFLRVRSGGRRGGVKRLAVFASLQALAGSADACLMTGVGLILLLPRRPGRLARLAPRLVAAVAVCVLLAAIQWLPTALLASQTSRAALETSGRLHWSVPPSSLIDLVLPISGGAHARPEAPEDLEEALRLIQWMYMGAGTLPLLVIGLRRSPRGAAILGFALLLALGRHTPLAGWLAHLPVVSSFRFPSKLLWLVAGCWATLAAIGLKTLTQRKVARDRLGIVTSAIVLLAGAALLPMGRLLGGDSPEWTIVRELLPGAVLALGGVILAASMGSRWGTSAACLLVALDLLGAGRHFNAYASEEMYTTRPAIADALDREGARRVYVQQSSRRESVSWKSPSGWTDKESYYFSLGQFLLPPQSVRWGIRGSFDGDFTGLARPEFALLSGTASKVGLQEPRWLELAGVTHAIRFDGLTPPEFRVVAQIPTFREKPVLILKVPDPLPLAYIARRVSLVPSAAAAMRALGDPAFDRTGTIVRVEGTGSGDGGGNHVEADGVARITSDLGGQVVIQAHLESAGTLVVLNAYSEGWRARVDGMARPVRPANLIFQSVDLEAGDHVVEFDYQTPGLMAGLWISALAWVALALSSAKGLRKA